MDLGSRILAWLNARGMTQLDLANKIKRSPAAVNAWVKGNAAPKQANLQSIVDALGVSMVEFYGRVPKAKRSAA